MVSGSVMAIAMPGGPGRNDSGRLHDGAGRPLSSGERGPLERGFVDLHERVVGVLDDGPLRRQPRQHLGGEEAGGGELALVEEPVLLA